MDSLNSSLKLLGNFVHGVISSPGLEADAAASSQPLNFDNIQGDIILGLPKKIERFMFYEITDVGQFRKNLFELTTTITTMKDVMNDRDAIQDVKRSGRDKLLPISGTNIAFSRTGLEKIGMTESLDDTAFAKGQRADSKDLGDPRDPSTSAEPNWIPEFKQQIDFVVLITGDSTPRITERIHGVEKAFGINTGQASVRQIVALEGSVRPGRNKGHEHFGYRDGISQPAIEHFGTPNPGQNAVPAGIALCGNPGDPRRHKRPAWAMDGSFLAFRYLEQLVPEFEDFVTSNPIPIDGMPSDLASSLAGARMFGRWKSGAPIDVTPLKDDLVLAGDSSRNNNFDFFTDHSQERCPFAAHIRKGNPRSDLKFLGGTTIRRIWRQGIPFGPEVTEEERRRARTLQRRGLLFACYQSCIDNGFSFVQQAWCNTSTFPPKLLPPTISGLDPIVGQNGGKSRDMFDPKALGKDLKLPYSFVVPKGGEYFFVPSIKTLRELFAV